jgi:hypothetical protein
MSAIEKSLPTIIEGTIAELQQHMLAAIERLPEDWTRRNSASFSSGALGCSTEPRTAGAGRPTSTPSGPGDCDLSGRGHEWWR